jgi:7-cyano-7-deazaguanine synthase
MMTKRKSVVLLSGGLDSSANLAFTDHFDEATLALTIDYGQRAAPSEIKAAKAIADHYSVQHQVLDLKWLGALGGNALTESAQDIPHFKTSELDDLTISQASAKAVWVPNRNGILINVAAAIAERMNAPQIVVGFNKEEAATFPDNSSQFLGVATLALKYSTRNGVKVGCYTDMMVKTEIVQALRNLPKKFPFEKIWSCYYGGDQPCQKCESCKRLERALK